MLMFLTFTLVVTACSSAVTNAAFDDSCQSEVGGAETCSAKGQRALLQASHKMVHAPPAEIHEAVKLLETVAVNNRINPSGAAAPLSEDGYAAVADRCCQAEMKVFISRQVVQLGYEVCEESGLNGLVPFHSCEYGAQTFAKLTSDILADAGKHCTWVALVGNCQAKPEDCEEFAGIEVADCGCSRSRAAKIDLFQGELIQTNLGGLGPDTGAEEMRVRNAGLSNIGEAFDMVITALTPFQSTYPQYNLLYSGFGIINIKPKSETFNGSVDFRFSFVKPGTDIPLELAEIHFSIFDLDGTTDAGGLEYVASRAYKGYVTDTNPSINATILEDGRTKFVSGNYENNVANPENQSAVLTDEQRQNSVMYFYQNVSSFDLTFGIIGDDIPVGYQGGRFLYFAGESSLNDRCGP